MTNFDWLSDLTPLHQAQEAWLDGSYYKPQTVHLLPDTAQPFYISCGSGLLAEHIRRFRFSPQFIQRMGQVTDERGRSLFQESFLNHLQRLRLRVNVNAAPEGTLLLPGEPIFVAQGPKLQLLLLNSAFRLFFWDSTHWATQAALHHWHAGTETEEDTPLIGPLGFNPEGWKKRALFIGGSPTSDNTDPALWQGVQTIETPQGQPLLQIRRLFKRETPLGDIWLTADQEPEASVSRTHADFSDLRTHQHHSIQMTRYQNLYQPVLLKGHPVLAEPSLGYLRQRMWKQLEAFKTTNLSSYLFGWMNE
ncbi:MAG: hypothetical protein JNJ57_09235 [Saprospiraceae bacterium]|nr:hypothetical protein [Saprospiraceae bacterium]